MANKKKVEYSPLIDQMFGSGEKEGRIVTWEEVDRTLLGDLVAVCSTVGCAVLFGTTRDRGAWAITFFWDGFLKAGRKSNKQPVYCNSAEMLESWVEELIEKWSALAGEVSGEI